MPQCSIEMLELLLKTTTKVIYVSIQRLSEYTLNVGFTLTFKNVCHGIIRSHPRKGKKKKRRLE